MPRRDEGDGERDDRGEEHQSQRRDSLPRTPADQRVRDSAPKLAPGH